MGQFDSRACASPLAAQTPLAHAGAMSTATNPRRPSDFNQLANLIGRTATGDAPKHDAPSPPREKNARAVEAGRAGGKKRGKARAEKMTQEERSSAAKNVTHSRWCYMAHGHGVQKRSQIEPCLLR